MSNQVYRNDTSLKISHHHHRTESSNKDAIQTALQTQVHSMNLINADLCIQEGIQQTQNLNGFRIVDSNSKKARTTENLHSDRILMFSQDTLSQNDSNQNIPPNNENPLRECPSSPAQGRLERVITEAAQIQETDQNFDENMHAIIDPRVQVEVQQREQSNVEEQQQQQQSNEVEESQDLEQEMSDEDRIRSGMIMKNVIVNWFNVFMFLLLESMRVALSFDYKVTIFVLMGFDFYGFNTALQKYRLNNSIDQEEYQSQGDIEFRNEYNKFLMLRVGELLVFIVFKLLVVFRLEIIEINLTVIAVVALVLIVGSIVFSLRIKVKEHNPIFNEKLMWAFKIFVYLQAILVSLKIENITEWSWTHTLVPSLIFLAFQIGISCLLFAMIIEKMRRQYTQKQNMVTHSVVGMAWLIIQQTSVSVVGVLFIIAFLKVHEGSSEEDYFLTLLITLCIYFLVMITLTKFQANRINLFIYEVSMIHVQMEQEPVEEVVVQEKVRVKKVKTFDPSEAEKLGNIPRILQKISSTYFSAFSEQKKGLNVSTSSSARNSKKKEVKFAQIKIEDTKNNNQHGSQKQKKRVNQLRQKSQSFMVQKNNQQELDDQIGYKFKSGVFDEEAVNLSIGQQQAQKGDLTTEENNMRKIAIDTDKKFRRLIETPSTVFSAEQQQQFKQMQPSGSMKKRLFLTPTASPRASISIDQTPFQFQKGVNFSQLSAQEQPNDHIQSSQIQDKQKVEGLDQQSVDQSNVTCLICFDNAPDSVYMPCGHGGVCYDCSVDILKRTGECYLCREKIKEILRLNMEERTQDNNFRVVAITTMVDESVREGTNRSEIMEPDGQGNPVAVVGDNDDNGSNDVPNRGVYEPNEVEPS